MICEKCDIEHDGLYGSGRFCSSICAKSFSTVSKRDEINSTVSKKLKGRKPVNHNGFRSGYDPRRKNFTDEDRVKAGETIRQRNFDKLKIENWEDLSNWQKKRLVLIQQNNCCFICGISQWQEKSITLELDHIDGNNFNNSRNNLRCLCPNCHSQTSNYRAKNISKTKNKITDEQLIEALKNQPNIRQALLSLGLKPQNGNYKRAKNLK